MKTRPTQYKVVYASEVGAELANGWRLYGSPFAAGEHGGSMQAVIWKQAKPDDESPSIVMQGELDRARQQFAREREFLLNLLAWLRQPGMAQNFNGPSVGEAIQRIERHLFPYSMNPLQRMKP